MQSNTRIKSIEQATRKTWDEWLKFMDRIGAKDLTHKDIASKVNKELEGKIESAGWWAQSITVTYEQHIGRRITGQRQDGTFEVSVSKSTKLGMTQLINRWIEFAKNEREIQEIIKEEPRLSATENRSHWRVKANDGTNIQITSEPKPNTTAAIIVTHSGLDTTNNHIKSKELWNKILEKFIKYLEQ